MPISDNEKILAEACDRAATLLAMLRRDQASLSKLPGASADEGKAAYLSAVDAAGRTYDNLRQVLEHGD
jgi:hypothetical protein